MLGSFYYGLQGSPQKGKPGRIKVPQITPKVISDTDYLSLTSTLHQDELWEWISKLDGVVVGDNYPSFTSEELTAVLAVLEAHEYLCKLSKLLDRGKSDSLNADDVEISKQMFTRVQSLGPDLIKLAPLESVVRLSRLETTMITTLRVVIPSISLKDSLRKSFAKWINLFLDASADTLFAVLTNLNGGFVSRAKHGKRELDRYVSLREQSELLLEILNNHYTEEYLRWYEKCHLNSIHSQDMCWNSLSLP